MSYRNKEDWDLCWYYLSGTGCRNKNCTWRHQNSAGRRFLNRIRKKRGMRRYYRGDSRKKPGAPFYPIVQHEDGGVEDQYGLVHYPEIGNGYASKMSIKLMKHRGHRQETRTSPMSLSSPVKTAPNSSSISIKSQGGSDSEGDIAKNAEAPMRKKVKVQKLERSKGLEGVLGEIQTTERLLKTKLHPDDKIASVLSPFAKVFVPRVNLVASTNARKASLEETSENILVVKVEQHVDLKSDETVIDEVNE